jgi:hypothetical protein
LYVALSASGRFLTYGQTGSDAGKDSVYYIVSAKYQTKPTSATGDVFAAIMGYKLGPNALFNYPYTAVAYVKGQVDLNTYKTASGANIQGLTADASGGVCAWAFIAIGEFCNKDGVAGYQDTGATGDQIIGYFTAPLGSDYRSSGWIDTTNGVKSYHASVESSLSNFNTSCRVFAANTAYQGQTKSAYDFKCDVKIDYTNLWSTNAVAINGCTDDNRYVGVMLDIVGAAFDINVQVEDLNKAIQNSATGNKIQFNSGKLEFSWANFIQAGTTPTTVVAANHAVIASFIKDDSTDINYAAAATAKQIIFTFDTPKSSGNNVFMWDPQTTVLDRASSSSVVVMLGLLLSSLLLMIF